MERWLFRLGGFGALGSVVLMGAVFALSDAILLRFGTEGEALMEGLLFFGVPLLVALALPALAWLLRAMATPLARATLWLGALTVGWLGIQLLLYHTVGVAEPLQPLLRVPLGLAGLCVGLMSIVAYRGAGLPLAVAGAGVGAAILWLVVAAGSVLGAGSSPGAGARGWLLPLSLLLWLISQTTWGIGLGWWLLRLGGKARGLPLPRHSNAS